MAPCEAERRSCRVFKVDVVGGVDDGDGALVDLAVGVAVGGRDALVAEGGGGEDLVDALGEDRAGGVAEPVERDGVQPGLLAGSGVTLADRTVGERLAAAVAEDVVVRTDEVVAL